MFSYSIEELKNFKGKVVTRGDENYAGNAYQYATSSYRELTNPLFIIYADGDEDVIGAINYAKKNHVAVAIRTGGHQYTAASSTNGDNIQLDLSSTYTDFDWEDTDHTVVSIGVSTSLGVMQNKLKKKGRFVPTGQCSYVHVGGHLHTGGYGQLIRSFGLFSDHVVKVRVITAAGDIEWVDRSTPEKKKLLYAILGGSPGNFCVVTHVTLKVRCDEDYSLSRGFRVVYPYSKETLKNLLDVLVDQDDTEEFPADYDYCITVSSGRAKENKPPGILVFAQWANLEGPNQIYNPAFFDKIRKAGGKHHMSPHDGVLIVDEPTAMSELCSHWINPTSREFQLPYYKRLYMSNERGSTLKANKWEEWVTGRVDDIVVNREKYQVFASCQFQYSGGKHSTFRTEGDKNLTSLSWRDSTFGCTLDAFYNGEGEPKAYAKKWADDNTAESVGHAGAKFSVQDRRLFWGSFDEDLPAHRAQYYDQEPTKYDELSKFKVEIDPDFVFTPNLFSIGPIPKRIRGTIEGVRAKIEE